MLLLVYVLCLDFLQPLLLFGGQQLLAFLVLATDYIHILLLLALHYLLVSDLAFLKLLVVLPHFLFSVVEDLSVSLGSSSYFGVDDIIYFPAVKLVSLISEPPAMSSVSKKSRS